MGTSDLLKQQITTVPDFPIAGIQFKDITPLLAHGPTFAMAIEELSNQLSDLAFDALLAIESRGFVIGAPLAVHFRRGLILVRKPGKLPGDTDAFPYTCEYCSGILEVRRGAIQPYARYLIVDDLLATGGTARATADYVKGRGGAVVGFCFLVELSFLSGALLLEDAPVMSVLKY